MCRRPRPLLSIAFLLAFSFTALAQRHEAERYLKASDSLMFISPDSSRMLASQALNIALAIKDDTLEARAYHLIGTTEGIQGHYSSAQQNLIRSLTISDRLNMPRKQVATLANIARVIDAQGRYADAIRYLKQALVLDRQLNDQEGVALDYQNLGVIFRRSGNNDSALYYLDRSLEQAKLLPKESRDAIVASGQYNIAYVYSFQGRYKEAEALLQYPVRYYDCTGDPYGILHGIAYKANLAYLTKNYKDAIALAGTGLEKAREMHMDERSADLLQILTDSYEAQGEFSKALHYYKEHRKLSDTLFNAEKARIVAELQYGYETEKKDREIELLKAKEEGHRIVIILVSVAALASIFLVITLFLSKKLQTVRYREKEAHLVAEREKGQLALESSERELGTTTAFLQQKNKLLEELQLQLAALSAEAGHTQQEKLTDLSNALTRAKLLTEDDWSQFRVIFDKVHPGFFNRLREQFYDLTPAETRLMALTHLNLGTKEIASMLGVSDQTVYKTRQRLRAKIGMSAEKGLDDLELNAV